MFPFTKERRHPAVIISNDETCQNSDIEEVNALLCTSAKVNREPKITEEVLDEADGRLPIQPGSLRPNSFVAKSAI